MAVERGPDRLGHVPEIVALRQERQVAGDRKEREYGGVEARDAVRDARGDAQRPEPGGASDDVWARTSRRPRAGLGVRCCERVLERSHVRPNHHGSWRPAYPTNG